mmetsp:Transcript_98138/g.210492  ORF Transcript_98138/g.210492 Transcript_98138/m.210492 type:complete len:804 (+) Transcript_98138:88-2499(+)
MAATSRDTVTRNSMIRAREAAQRFPENKALCKTFLSSFIQTPAQSGLPLHKKYGQRKYMVLLQQAANNRLETINIDLNDVEEFCNKEMLDPAHLDQGVPKISLQKDLESLVADIENNTARYWAYFMEACDALLPDRDEDVNTDSTVVRQENMKRWREERAAEQQQQEGGSAIADAKSLVPLKARNNFNVRFMPRASMKSSTMREILAPDVGGLVKLDCLVVRVSEVKPKVELVHYKCEVCQADMFLTVEGERYTPPKECPSQQCQNNKRMGKLNCYIRNCVFTKYQEMRVQETSAQVPVGGVPRGINVILAGDLTRKVLPGEAITITGVYSPYSLPWFQASKKGTMQEMYLDAHSIKKHKHGYNEETTDSKELERKIDEAHLEGEEKLYERASRSIAPEIFGHDDVKKALLLALVGSVTKTQKDGMKIRGDIHTLFMGDPGVAKSQLLKQAVNIAPRSVYTTGKGSSGVGLTAAVVRDNQTGEVSLEGGALVLADTGICCIDEFDKMDENDRTAIHEVMEQQTVSIAKSGITTSLNCRTTILAAANPHFGRYNPFRSPVENINLPASLISRFDLLFLLLDTVDNEKDKQLAMHVLKVHSSYQQEGAAADEKKDDTEDADILNLGFTPFDASFMRAYIRKARTFEPLIEDAVMEDIVDAYVSMRDDEKRGDMDSRKSYTTPRTLQAIMRLSQAHARVRFSKTVQRKDFDEAMRLMKASKESVELSAPASKGANPLDLVYDIISDLSKHATESDGWVDLTHVSSMAANKALTEEMVIEAIENWESLNVLGRNDDKTKVKFMMPAA